MREVAIIGCGMTRFGKLEQGLVDLLVEASLAAITDAGVSEREFDALYVGNMCCGELNKVTGVASVLADRIGLIPAAADRVENGPASGGSAVKAGFMAIASGLHDLVLVAGGEKMTGASTGKLADIVSTLLHPYEYACGATLPSLGGLLMRMYMEKYGVKREAISLVAVKNHKNGSLNPYAHFQREITIDDVLNSPVVADPLRLYDVCPVSDGAAAVILCPAERAREFTDTPVLIKGVGQATDIQSVTERSDPTVLNALRVASEKAYSMAGVKASDVDVAELHDAFTVLEVLQSEDVGFFKKGEGARAVEEGDTWIGGRIPINPSGGLKARGHPLGATGVAQLVELTWQLRGEAGRRQVDGAEVGLAVNFGGFGNNILVHVVCRR